MTVAATDLIRSVRFRTEREPGWRRLEALLKRAEAAGVRALSYDEALELSDLYQQAINALSVARAISMDAALLTYLDALSARAYLVVYAPQESLRGLLSDLIRHGFPQAVRRSLPVFAVALVALVLGVVVGAKLVGRDPGWYFTFVPPDLADGRTPQASAAYLRSTLFGSGAVEGRELLATLSSFLFSHNTQIAILTFALGLFAILPAFALTFYNGLMMGAFWALFARKGLSFELFGWLSIHGVTEITALLMACAGGTQLGLAVLLPGDHSRTAALRKRGRDAVKLVGLAALMLAVAALVEGFLRQIVQDTWVRLAIGWGLGLVWLAWFGLSGRKS
jgi:uncharacterized membrane protein SpoIIM required for sporulation